VFTERIRSRYNMVNTALPSLGRVAVICAPLVVLALRPTENEKRTELDRDQKGLSGTGAEIGATASRSAESPCFDWCITCAPLTEARFGKTYFDKAAGLPSKDAARPYPQGYYPGGIVPVSENEWTILKNSQWYKTQQAQEDWTDKAKAMVNVGNRHPNNVFMEEDEAWQKAVMEASPPKVLIPRNQVQGARETESRCEVDLQNVKFSVADKPVNQQEQADLQTKANSGGVYAPFFADGRKDSPWTLSGLGDALLAQYTTEIPGDSAREEALNNLWQDACEVFSHSRVSYYDTFTSPWGDVNRSKGNKWNLVDLNPEGLEVDGDGGYETDRKDSVTSKKFQPGAFKDFDRDHQGVDVWGAKLGALGTSKDRCFSGAADGEWRPKWDRPKK